MPNGVDSASFYADFGALSSLQRQVKQKDPQALREAARQFESLFTAMMLKSMRQAKLGDELGESDESDMYQEMYDQQLAVQMSQGKGLGLADMLVRQLTRRGEIPAATGNPASTSGGALAPGGTQTGQGVAAGGTMRGFPATRSFPAHPAGRGSEEVGGHGARRGTGGEHAGKSGGASLSERIGFVQKLAPYAERAADALGVSADTLIAQAALETGWGRHVAGGTGSSSSHNFFGIKSGSDWQGARATAATTEYTGEAAARVAQSFRQYDSVQQGVNDYVALLQSHPGYRAALGSGSNAGAFAGALARGGYATDPDYAHKLVATTASVRSLRSLAGAMASTATSGTGSAELSQLQPQAPAPTEAPGGSIREALLKLLAAMPIAHGEDPA